jgi:hypothetical protein
VSLVRSAIQLELGLTILYLFSPFQLAASTCGRYYDDFARTYNFANCEKGLSFLVSWVKCKPRDLEASSDL